MHYLYFMGAITVKLIISNSHQCFFKVTGSAVFYISTTVSQKSILGFRRTNCFLSGLRQNRENHENFCPAKISRHTVFARSAFKTSPLLPHRTRERTVYVLDSPLLSPSLVFLCHCWPPCLSKLVLLSTRPPICCMITQLNPTQLNSTTSCAAKIHSLVPGLFSHKNRLGTRLNDSGP